MVQRKTFPGRHGAREAAEKGEKRSDASAPSFSQEGTSTREKEGCLRLSD